MKFTRRSRNKPQVVQADLTDLAPETAYSDAPQGSPESVETAAASEDPATVRWRGGQPFKVGYATHVGCVRSRNEDSVLVMTLSLLGDMTDLTLGLFVVADGMGGHNEGQKASQMATRVLAREVMGRLYSPFLRVDDSETPEPVLTILAESLQMANWRINRENPESGTTLTAGLVVGNRLYMAHVGDSRAYLISGAESDSALLTLDHSFVQRLQDSGQISAEEALVHPKRNILYRAVGQGERLEIDTFSRMIPRPGWLLMCSDGLWGIVKPESLSRTVATAQDPQQVCNELVSEALEAGAPDNISVVVIRFEDSEPGQVSNAAEGVSHRL